MVRKRKTRKTRRVRTKADSLKAVEKQTIQPETVPKAKYDGKYPDYLRLIPDYDPIATKEDCWFDIEAAELAIDFFSECLHLWEGVVGDPPFILRPWQKAIVGNLFGWKRPDGTRRYRASFIEVPRKNGKTPLMAGIVLLVAYTDGEPGAQIYSSAREREQAAIIFKHAEKMIERDPDLAARSKVYKTFRSIEFNGGDSVYKALSADADTKHGANIHCVINDELHVHKNRDLIDTLETATASRKQPLIIDITTAGWDKTTICFERYEYASKVRDGVIKDKALLPVIYEIKKEDYKKWDTIDVWKRCNPNFGISVSEEYFVRQCNKAKETPAYENTFRRLHLNQWTSLVSQWLSMAKWDLCNEKPSDSKTLDWIGGLDLSASQDLTAYVLSAFDENGKLHVHAYPFIPADIAVVKEKTDRVPYLTWHKQGFIDFTDGDVVDYDHIREKILELNRQYDVIENVYDPFNATQLVTQLHSEGLNCVSYGQGIKNMSEPSKVLEQLILKLLLAHGGHPVLTWCASNVMVKMDENENIKPVKTKGTKRIDPMIALIMTIARHISGDAKPKKSKYEDEEPIVL